MLRCSDIVSHIFTVAPDPGGTPSGGVGTGGPLGGGTVGGGPAP